MQWCLKILIVWKQWKYLPYHHWVPPHTTGITTTSFLLLLPKHFLERVLDLGLRLSLFQFFCQTILKHRTTEQKYCKHVKRVFKSPCRMEREKMAHDITALSHFRASGVLTQNGLDKMANVPDGISSHQPWYHLWLLLRRQTSAASWRAGACSLCTW